MTKMKKLKRNLLSLDDRGTPKAFITSNGETLECDGVIFIHGRMRVVRVSSGVTRYFEVYVPILKRFVPLNSYGDHPVYWMEKSKAPLTVHVNRKRGMNV